MHLNQTPVGFNKIASHPAWVLIAAFGTYFCMYGFRKPYTAATYADASFWGLQYKFLLIISQTIGYVIAKWVGIKFVSEIKREHRIGAILGLITFSELMLLLFGIVPRPWNMVCLFFNGLPLGVIFGLVLSFVEGRKNTEFLIAGLCASFIVSDGVSKSVGALLLSRHVSENWMPFLSGAVFMVPTLIFVAMLACVPPPSAADVLARSARKPMDVHARLAFFNKYAPGLAGISAIYLFVTLLRSIRADFAVELWVNLCYHQSPSTYTQSELFVSLGVIVLIGLTALVSNHYNAFRFSLLLSFIGLVILLICVVALNQGLNSFIFMVLAGLGVYIPYVAIHAIVFERLIAVTKEHANVGFLMYIVDSVGYTGYILLILLKRLLPPSESILSIFLNMCVWLGAAGVVIVVGCYFYFKLKLIRNEQPIGRVSAGQSSNF